MALPSISLVKKVIAAGLDRLEMPYKINFVVTKECHSRCVNCRIWQTPPKNELTFDEIKKFAQANPFLSWVNFTGGEPTDRKDLPEIVQAFVEHSHELSMIHLPTNGLRPDYIANTAHKIVEAALSTAKRLNKTQPKVYMTVSVDGPPEENDRLRGIKGDFQSAMLTYQKLKSIPNLDVYIGMTLYPTNHKMIKETYDSIKSQIPNFDYHHFHVNLAHVSQHYYENSKIKNTTRVEMIESLEKYRKDRGLLISPIDWIENQFLKLAGEYIKTGQTPIDCAAISSSLFITETGAVYPCSIWGRALGQLRDTNFELKPILESKKSNELKSEIQKKKCANCWTPCEAFQSIAADRIRSLNPFAQNKMATNSPNANDESNKKSPQPYEKKTG